MENFSGREKAEDRICGQDATKPEFAMQFANVVVRRVQQPRCKSTMQFPPLVRVYSSPAVYLTFFPPPPPPPEFISPKSTHGSSFCSVKVQLCHVSYQEKGRDIVGLFGVRREGSQTISLVISHETK